MQFFFKKYILFQYENFYDIYYLLKNKKKLKLIKICYSVLYLKVDDL